MPGNDVAGRIGEGVGTTIAFQNFADVEGERVGQVSLHVRVVVRSIGSEHYPTPARSNTDHLQAHTVATDMMHAQPGLNLFVARMKHHAAIIQAADHRHHIFGGKGKARVRVGHVTACTELHFPILDMIAGFWEHRMVSGVIVMHVAQNDIGYLGWIDADTLQAFARGTEKLTAALLAHLFVESRIDDIYTVGRSYHPDKIIHGHGALVVRIPSQKIFPSRSVVMRVTERIRLPDSSAHILRLSYNVTL